MNFLFATRNIR